MFKADAIDLRPATLITLENLPRRTWLVSILSTLEDYNQHACTKDEYIYFSAMARDYSLLSSEYSFGITQQGLSYRVSVESLLNTLIKMPIRNRHLFGKKYEVNTLSYWLDHGATIADLIEDPETEEWIFLKITWLMARQRKDAKTLDVYDPDKEPQYWSDTLISELTSEVVQLIVDRFQREFFGADIPESSGSVPFLDVRPSRRDVVITPLTLTVLRNIPERISEIIPDTEHYRSLAYSQPSFYKNLAHSSVSRAIPMWLSDLVPFGFDDKAVAVVQSYPTAILSHAGVTQILKDKKDIVLDNITFVIRSVDDETREFMDVAKRRGARFVFEDYDALVDEFDRYTRAINLFETRRADVPLKDAITMYDFEKIIDGVRDNDITVTSHKSIVVRVFGEDSINDKLVQDFDLRFVMSPEQEFKMYARHALLQYMVHTAETQNKEDLS